MFQSGGIAKHNTLPAKHFLVSIFKSNIVDKQNLSRLTFTPRVENSNRTHLAEPFRRHFDDGPVLGCLILLRPSSTC